MRIAIIGGSGQLAADLTRSLPGVVQPYRRSEVDLTRPESFATLHSFRPEVVVNCAAYNLVDKAESDRDSVFAVNAWGVAALADWCNAHRCRLVHFSTDYVFGLDGERMQPYLESDATGPVNTYGLSKLVGELEARRRLPECLVIRTCGLYGLHGNGGKGTNFVEKMLQLGVGKKTVRVVADQRCTPTFTEDLAAATVRLIEHGRRGLYHITNSGSCTWFEFAQAIFQEYRLTVDVVPISSQEFSAAAQRPGYSVLDTEHDLRAEGIIMPTWREALAAYLGQRRRMHRQPA